MFIISVAEAFLPVDPAQGRKLGTNCDCHGAQGSYFPEGSKLMPLLRPTRIVHLNVCSRERCGLLSHEVIGEKKFGEEVAVIVKWIRTKNVLELARSRREDDHLSPARRLILVGIRLGG